MFDYIIKFNFAFGFIVLVNNTYNFELKLVRLNRVASSANGVFLLQVVHDVTYLVTMD